LDTSVNKVDEADLFRVLCFCVESNECAESERGEGAHSDDSVAVVRTLVQAHMVAPDDVEAQEICSGVLAKAMAHGVTKKFVRGEVGKQLGDLIALLRSPSLRVRAATITVIGGLFQLSDGDVAMLRTGFGLVEESSVPQSGAAEECGSTMFKRDVLRASSNGTSARTELEHFASARAKVTDTLQVRDLESQGLQQLGKELEVLHAVVSVGESAHAMILTPTTECNLMKVIQGAQNPIPVLLEGATGVGKSATIALAAQQSGRTLVRFNMSSRITIDDLLGKVTLQTDAASGTEFAFVKQQ
jgi:hypothetical protein